MLLIHEDSTAGAGVTVPASETVLKTFTPPENAFSRIYVVAQVRLVQTGASAGQNVTFRIKIGGTTKAFTFSTQAAVKDDIFTLTFMERCNSKTAVDVTIQGAGADANTTATALALYAFGVHKSLI